MYDAAPRKSFVVALKDIPEVWEISYDPKAEPIYDGLVHDYKMGEAIAKPGYLGVRRTPLDEPLDDFFFDQSYRHVLGATRPRADGSPNAQVVNLDVRRQDRRRCRSPACRTWARASPSRGTARTVLATPNLKDGVVSVIDMKTWKTVKTIATLGPGFFMRSHENTPYAWVDSMMSPTAKDTLTIIDKRTLEPVAHACASRAKRWRTSSSPGTAATRWPACGRRTAR